MAELPSTKPTGATDWATAGTRTDPGAPKRLLGWIFGEKPPFDFFNAIQGIFGDFLTWLKDLVPRAFDGFYEGVRTVSIGDIFRTAEFVPRTFDDGDIPVPFSGGEEATYLATDGLQVYIADAPNAEVYAYDSETLLGAGAKVWGEGLADVAAVNQMHTDGAVLAIAQQASATHELTVLNTTTGAILFTDSPGGDIAAVVCDSDITTRRVFYASGTTDRILLWIEGAGSSIFIATLGGRILALETTPDYVLAVRTDGLGPNGLVVVKINRAGTAQSVIAAFPGEPHDSAARICSDGEHAWVSIYRTSAPAAAPIVARVPITNPVLTYAKGDPYWEIRLATSGTTAEVLTCCLVDDRFVYVKGMANEFYVLAKDTGAVVHFHPVFDSAVVDIDGENVWRTRFSAQTAIDVLGTDRQPGFWLRTGDGKNGAFGSMGGRRRKPFKKMAIPMSEGR